jgi:hypothetical protein
MRPAAQRQLGPLAGQPPVDRGRAHLHQQRRLLVAEVQLAVAAQDRHQHRQHRRQPLPRRRPQDRPTGHQRRDDPRPVRRRARRSWLDHLQLQRVAQRSTRVVAMPASQLDQLIKGAATSSPGQRGHTPVPSPWSRPVAGSSSTPSARRMPARSPAPSATHRYAEVSSEATYRATPRFLMSQRASLTPLWIAA